MRNTIFDSSPQLKFDSLIETGLKDKVGWVELSSSSSSVECWDWE
jgi:hypothetical protein